MAEIIGWIVFGLLAGIVAKFLMPGKDPGGFFLTVLLGIAGALVGGFIGRSLGIGHGNFAEFTLAVIGAFLLLLGYRMLRGKTTAPR